MRSCALRWSALSARVPLTRPRCSAVAAALALGAVVALFLLLKLFALRPHPNDDGMYFYGAAAIARGAMPYRDFFHAHPPLHLAPTALLFVVTGYSFILGKSMVFVLAAAQGVCAFLIVRRLARGQAAAGQVEAAAVTAAALLLFSETFLVASSDDTGLVQSSALLASAATALAFGRPLAAGGLAGAAVMTSLQTAFLALALPAAAGAMGSRRHAFRVAAAMGAVVGGTHLIALAIAGRAFLDQVYEFHLAKVPVPGEGARALVHLVLHNFPLFALGATGLFVLYAAGGPARRLAAVLASAIAFHLLAMATRPRVFYWYFVPALFPLAVAAALGCVLPALAWTARPKGGAALLPTGRRALGLVAAGACAMALIDPAGVRGIDSPHLHRGYTSFTRYEWQDAPGLGSLNAVVRALLWRGGTRSAPDGRASAVTEYLWRQSTWLDTHAAMVVGVRKAASSRPGAVLYGDYATAPLVALDAGLPVLNHDVDTTGQRFASGFRRPEQVVRELAQAPAVFVLLRPGGSGVNRLVRWERLTALCTLEASFTSRSAVRHTLYVCDRR